jgi:phosphomannomutase
MNNLSHEEISQILDRAYKTYDVRGIVGRDITIEVAYATGAAFVDEIEAAGKNIIIGHDMRPSSEPFAAGFAQGARERGANIIFMGLCSTDENYFASGLYNSPSAMFTASHNPAEYNGIKMCRAGAKSISKETGLDNIKKRALKYMVEGVTKVENIGTFTEKDVLKEYVSFMRDTVPLEEAKPLKIVIDTANGMGGFTVPAVFGDKAGFSPLPFEIVPLYFELDGSFPNHEANPLDVENLKDLRAKVLETGADLGLAFDGDADRCFVVDNEGNPVEASTVSAIISLREIKFAKKCGEQNIKVLYSLTSSRNVPEVIESEGAEPVRVKVGHSLAKAEMARTGAIFGGEHSGHYYFKSMWNADSGMLAALHVIGEISNTGMTMAELSKKYTPYFSSGEINAKVEDPTEANNKILEAFNGRGEIDYLDGIMITNEDAEGNFWWVSVRSSNTEPLLRLNVEASSKNIMEKLRDEVLLLID